VNAQCQVTELAGNRITRLGGRHQRRLVIYTQNSSGIKRTPLSGRFRSVRSDTTAKRAQKLCAPILERQ